VTVTMMMMSVPEEGGRRTRRLCKCATKRAAAGASWAPVDRVNAALRSGAWHGDFEATTDRHSRLNTLLGSSIGPRPLHQSLAFRLRQARNLEQEQELQQIEPAEADAAAATVGKNRY